MAGARMAHGIAAIKRRLMLQGLICLALCLCDQFPQLIA